MKHTNISSLIVAVVLSGMLAGCAANEIKKQAVVEHWEKSTAEAKLSTVENLIEQGQTAEARKTLEKCLAAAPESAQAHFLMGRVYFIENRAAQAETSFDRAVMLDETLDAAWYYRGGVAFLKGDDALAMTYYQKALSLKPVETDYITAIAQLYMKTDRNEQAQLSVATSNDVVENFSNEASQFENARGNRTARTSGKIPGCAPRGSARSTDRPSPSKTSSRASSASAPVTTSDQG